jgi:MYXO-CTERM domain-containing protein
LPLALNVDDHTLFYVRRWASDGLDESAREPSLFNYEPADEGPATETKKAGCACRTGGSPPSAGDALVGLVIAGLALPRRRRR